MNKYLIRLQTLFNFCEPSSSQLPVPNEKMGAAIASNDSKIKVDPELCLKMRLLMRTPLFRLLLQQHLPSRFLLQKVVTRLIGWWIRKTRGGLGADDESYKIFEKKLEILELGNNESYEDMLRIEEDPELLHENEVLDGDTIVKVLTAQD